VRPQAGWQSMTSPVTEAPGLERVVDCGRSCDGCGGASESGTFPWGRGQWRAEAFNGYAVTGDNVTRLGRSVIRRGWLEQGTDRQRVMPDRRSVSSAGPRKPIK